MGSQVRWSLFCAAIVVVWGAASPGHAQSGPRLVVSGSDTALPAGSFFRFAFDAYPEADAPGEASAIVDPVGIGEDGFVQRPYATTLKCRPTGPCEPCPAGAQCFESAITLDVSLAPGRRTIPITVTDARGRTSRSGVSIDILPPQDQDADGLPDRWEERFGLDARNAGGDHGASGDPDGDGQSNLDELRRGTNPSARYYRYFAEASSGDRAPGFEQCFAIAGPRLDAFGGVWLTLIGDEGRRLITTRGFGDRTTFVCPLDRYSHPADRVVAAIIEANAPLVAERFSLSPTSPRTIEFGTDGMAAPSKDWFFADGGADGTLDTFYLAFNPNPAPVDATFTWRRPDGEVALQQTRVLEPGKRTTIWVNADAPQLGREEASTTISAAAPILIERAWRHDPPGRTVTQQTASPGTPDPSSRWFFPEVSGRSTFATSIVLSNPADREAVLDVNLLYDNRDAVGAGQIRVPPGGRRAIPARGLPGVDGGRASVEIVSLNGVRVVGERMLGGNDADGQWRQASIGARAPGVRWTLGDVGSASDIVLTNVSAFPARVQLSFIASYSYSENVTTSVEVPARSRLVYPLSAEPNPQRPWVAGTLRVESQSTDRGRAELVVERVSFFDVGGVAGARATGLIAWRVED